MATVIATLLLATHLLAMNVASAGPLAWAWLVGGAASGDDQRVAWARRVALLSLAGLGLGAILGGILLALPNEPLWAALRRFPASAYWFAMAELAFSAVWMLGLALASRKLAGKRVWAWLLALVTASNLLYHFPPLMAVIGRLTSNPRWTTVEIIDRPALRELWLRPEVMALWLHVTLASLAIAALAALWPALRDSDGLGSEELDSAARRLAAASLGATLLQAPVGIWVLVASSPQVRDALIGEHLGASAVFVASIATAFGLLQSTARLALGDLSRRSRCLAAVLAAVVVLLMSGALLLSRRAEAAANGSAEHDPQPGNPLTAGRLS